MEAAKNYSRTSTNIELQTEVKASSYPTIFHGIVYLPKETSSEVFKTQTLREACERAFTHLLKQSYLKLFLLLKLTLMPSALKVNL